MHDLYFCACLNETGRPLLSLFDVWMMSVASSVAHSGMQCIRKPVELTSQSTEDSVPGGW